VHAAGFVGSKNLGSRIAGEHLLKHVIGTKEPEYTTPYDINLIGEYNVTGDMWQYTPLLERIGVRVLSTMSGDGRVADIATAHRAKLNVIVCAKSLITLCKKMEERFLIPYISVSFYGLRDTKAAIMEIVEAFNDPQLKTSALEVLEKEEVLIRPKLQAYRERFKGVKAIVNTGGNKSWSIVSGLQDLGIDVVATSIRKATEDDIEKARHYLGPSGILMKSPAKEQGKLIDEHGVSLLLAGGRSLYTALKKRIAFIDVNQEKHVSYGGFQGLLNLGEDLLQALENPVFKHVGKEAPWVSSRP